jgi:hypothetical protein
MDDSPNLLALLKDHDCPCPACGYNLRGANRCVCPECGKAFDLPSLLNRQDGIDLAWLVMVISFAAALPWSLFHTWQRMVIRGKILYGDDWNPKTKDYGKGLLDRPWDEAIWMLASATWWLSVPLVCLALIVLRHRITRMPKAIRWALAILSVVMLLLAFRRWQWWWFAMGLQGPGFHSWRWWYYG